SAAAAPREEAAIAPPGLLAPVPPRRPVPVVRPSLAGPAGTPERFFDTAAEAVIDADAARREGIALHALLQHLGRIPRPDWESVARRALQTLLPDAPDRHQVLAAKAISLLSRPELAHLFGA